MVKVLEFLKSLPGKVLVGFVIVFTVLFALLKFLGASTVLKAKELNLGALIEDALVMARVKERKKKIEDLDKPPKTETDPDKVEEFYKNRK